MLLNKYSIELEQLTVASIEQVRQWRNSAAVSNFMEFKKEISTEEQRIWFDQINPKTEFYFIIKKEDYPIGLIHLNRINSETKSGEVGLFIGETQFHGTGITWGASLSLLDFAFEKIQLEEVVAKVNPANTEAIRYNSFLGFIESHSIQNNFTLWKLSKENYYKNKEKIIKLFG